MAVHKMLLHPADPHCPPIAKDVLAERLQSIGLIAAPVRIGSETIYPAGEYFLQLITFLGCSPAIEIELPTDADSLEAASRDGRFCHVTVTGDGQNLQFRAATKPAVPRCPQCRKPDPHWPENLHSWQEDRQQLHWSCALCGYSGQLTDLNFRKSAGFARTFIEIRGIYPAEAIPGEALLASLQALSGCKWNILYINE
ncbi:MAG: hypothetical protein WBN90_01720 [Gammaproteobacteria bacterium]